MGVKLIGFEVLIFAPNQAILCTEKIPGGLEYMKEGVINQMEDSPVQAPMDKSIIHPA